MGYITVYLRADDEQTLRAALEQVLPLDADGEIITASHSHCLVMLPHLCAPTGKTLTDAEGNEYPETQQVPGAHANLRTKNAAAVEQLREAGVVVEPETPMVIFA